MPRSAAGRHLPNDTAALSQAIPSKEGENRLTVATVIEVFHLQGQHRERGETVYERLHGDVEYRHVLQALPPECVRVEAWETRYRAVWTCAAERCVITLVEGDGTVAQYDDEARYQQGLEDATRFYARHR